MPFFKTVSTWKSPGPKVIGWASDPSIFADPDLRIVASSSAARGGATWNHWPPGSSIAASTPAVLCKRRIDNFAPRQIGGLQTVAGQWVICRAPEPSTFISQICQGESAVFLPAKSTRRPSKEVRGSAAAKKSGVRVRGVWSEGASLTKRLPWGKRRVRGPGRTSGAWTMIRSGRASA